MTTRPTKRQLLGKRPTGPRLYRHKTSGAYYGTKKHRGKEKAPSPAAPAQRLAQPEPKEWSNGLGKPIQERSNPILNTCPE